MVRSGARWSTSVRHLGAAAVFMVVLVSCGDDATTKASTSRSGAAAASGGYAYGAPAATTAAAAPTTTAATAAGPLNVKVATTSLGSVLVDGAGRTLYVFTKDEKNKSNCAGACAATWPALYGTPTAGAGVTGAKLGSFATADGKTQATIDGQPLYYYGADTAAGDMKGQNVGTVWFVVDGAGVIKKADAAPSGY